MKIKCNLDRRQRQFFSSSIGIRIKLERSLLPSAATLIIVPLVLLEHWYEQLHRHIGMLYLVNNNEGRGVVYLDGLGNII